MNRFGQYLKSKRIEAGLTQQQVADKLNVSKNAVQNWESGNTKIKTDRFSQLAYIYNISVQDLWSEIEKIEDLSQSNWPDFLFEEDINTRVSQLHLNRNQQELFGLLYIYEAEYLKNDTLGYDTFEEDLKRIPYGFIEKVGSIQFLNLAHGLHQVLKYVKTDFLTKMLRLNPEAEFDICRMSKEEICEFIDNGYKNEDSFATGFDEQEYKYEGDEALNFGISMEKAGKILPLLEKAPIWITTGTWHSKLQKDIPREVVEMCGMDYACWKDNLYKDEKINIFMIRYGIEAITKYESKRNNRGEEQWFLSINNLGYKLLNWFRVRG